MVRGVQDDSSTQGGDNNMKLYSCAPMRVDLAGGTLDIFPLYIFEEGGLTLNAAITLMSEVWIETCTGSRVRIISEDLGREVSAPRIGELDPARGLDLLVRIVRFFKDAPGMTIRTRNNVPRGSGLGASSSLLIALCSALNMLCGGKYDIETIIDIGANLEAQSIRIPTGKQDYYSAAYGGVSCISFDVDGTRRTPLLDSEELINELENRLVVTFAGEPRFSGSTNWDMTRAYINGDKNTVRNIGRIKNTALRMRDCLRSGGLEAFGRLLGEEWENRKLLADGVTNEQINRYMEIASGAGAIASKICGAGGGGCMISFCSEGAAGDVRAALADAGADVLDCSIARAGVKVVEEL